MLSSVTLGGVPVVLVGVAAFITANIYFFDRLFFVTDWEQISQRTRLLRSALRIVISLLFAVFLSFSVELVLFGEAIKAVIIQENTEFNRSAEQQLAEKMKKFESDDATELTRIQTRISEITIELGKSASPEISPSINSPLATIQKSLDQLQAQRSTASQAKSAAELGLRAEDQKISVKRAEITKLGASKNKKIGAQINRLEDEIEAAETSKESAQKQIDDYKKEIADACLCASVRSQCHAIDSPARSVSGA
jgi:hypothetical protein